MYRLAIILSIFVVAGFLALGLRVTKTNAGVFPVPCDGTVDCCMGYNCTVFCWDEPGGKCSGDEPADNSGSDVYCGSQLSDSINAGDGDDIVCAGKGLDQVNAGNDADMVSGGQGNDIISGGFGDDMLDGGPGIDTISGAAGDDYIEGGKGADMIFGGSEVIADECHGGPQDDSFDECECGSEGPTNGPQAGGEGDDLDECV